MRPIVTTRGRIRWGALTLLVATLGCAEDPTSPSTPASDPMLEATATQVLSFKQVSAGRDHSCGVTQTNLAYCWGSNASGKLGTGGTASSTSTPVLVAGNLRFDRVSAGDQHTCGITTTYRAYCWGSNFYGELGDGTTTQRRTPTAVAGSRTFRQITAGPKEVAGGYTCAVSTSDLAFCWGWNEDGRLGIGTGENSRLTPTRVAGGLRFRQVIAGGLHVCGATIDDRAYCWGSNHTGALGTTTPSPVAPRPVAVAGGLRFRMVVAGGGHVLIPSEEHEDGTSCGLTTEGLAYCWGAGDSYVGGGRSPQPVPGGRRFRGINLSDRHACAVTFSDEAFCWGYNGYGQVGDGTTTTRYRTPVRVAGGVKFKSVTTNTRSNHSCGVTTTNRAYCWGLGTSGQLGTGTRPHPGQLTPAPVAPPM